MGALTEKWDKTITSQRMIDELPDRHLTKEEVDQLRDSDRFKDIHIRGRFLGPLPGTVSELVITLSDGTEKAIRYSPEGGGWKIIEPVGSEPDTHNDTDTEEGPDRPWEVEQNLEPEYNCPDCDYYKTGISTGPHAFLEHLQSEHGYSESEASGILHG